MIAKLRNVMIVAALAVGAVAFIAAPEAVYASPASEVEAGLNAAGGGGSTQSFGSIVATVVKVLLYVIGGVSVIMIIIGGFRYVISQGDSSSVTSAKNTILYAVIGLLVAIFAYAIVSFVVNSFA